MLLISNPQESHWQSIIRGIVQPLGSLEITSERDWADRTRHQSYPLIIIDANITTDPAHIVRQLRLIQPEARIVVMADAPTWRQARELFFAGAADYIPKLLSPQKLLVELKQVLYSPVSQR